MRALPGLGRRDALAALSFVLAAWLLALGDIFPSAHRWFAVLLAPALIHRRARSYVRDFAPFAVAVLGYEWARTLAHRINPHPFYRPQLDVDKVIGLGRIPTVRLQGWLYGGHPRFFEHTLDRVHDWYFGVLLATLFLLWLESRREYLRAAGAALGCAFAAAIGFVLFPAAPPWLARCHHLAGPLDRIREHGHQCPRALTDPSLVTRLFDDNPVAAIPSLHGAWSTLAALILWRWRPRLWPLGVAYALLQQFAVVYLGEHYVIDILIGDALAVLMWWLSGRLVLDRRRGAQPRARAISDSIS
jgi:PAP2 superfamily